MEKMTTNQAHVLEPMSKKQLLLPFELRIGHCQLWQTKPQAKEGLAFPCWNLYWNKNQTMMIRFQGQEQPMLPDKVYVIPPNTRFNFLPKVKNTSEQGQNNPYKPRFHRQQHIDNKMIPLLSVSFNLGIPFDLMPPAIHTTSLTACQQEKLLSLCQQLQAPQQEEVTMNFQIYGLVFELLSLLEIDFKSVLYLDPRILQITGQITQNPSENYTNTALASLVNMAPNSFCRLFKKQTHVSLQHFIKVQKIKIACKWFDHQDISIEKVAHRLGFADRYHFSRVFKQIQNCSPGAYLRRHTQEQ